MKARDGIQSAIVFGCPARGRKTGIQSAGGESCCSVLGTTFTLAKTEVRRAGGELGQFTLYYWKYLLFSNMSEAVFFKPLLNSLLIAVGISVISVPLGSIMAWLMVRSDIPGKKLLSMLIIVPYMIPSWVKSMSWLSIFRNSTSGSLGLLAGMGVNVPDWLAYGPVAIILVMSLHYYAFSYIMVSSSLSSINSELEEMGEIQGASKTLIIRKITLPLVLPALLSAIIMTLSKSIGSYGVAANLGQRIGYFTLATRLKDYMGTGVKGVAYAMALMMVLLASGCLYANKLFTGTRKSYATIGGKGGRSTLVSLGKARYPLMVALILFLVLALVFPMLVLVLESFQINTGGGYSLSNLTTFFWAGKLDDELAWLSYPGIFNNPDFLKALWNTVRLTIIAALITGLCGQFFGYISARGRGKWYGSLTEQLVFVPYLVPSIAFSAIFLAMFSKRIGPIPSLYGTFALLVLVSVVKHFPMASRAGTANMLQISGELEEAADIAGASFWRRMTRIVIPLAKNGFFSGFVLVFISIAKELDLIALLMTPSTRTLSYLSFYYSTESLPQMADAIAICIIAFIMISYWASAKFFHADVTKSMG